MTTHARARAWCMPADRSRASYALLHRCVAFTRANRNRVPRHTRWGHSARNVSDLTRDVILDTITQVTANMQTAFPGIKLYPCLGNHDYDPSNNWPTNTTQSLWLFETLASMLAPASLAPLRMPRSSSSLGAGAAGAALLIQNMRVRLTRVDVASLALFAFRPTPHTSRRPR